MLPEWLERVTLRGITVCGDQVDLRVSHGAGQIAVTALSRTGQLRVVSVT